MIVKDEESNIGRCLNSVKNLVDEIVIIDTGSQDMTKKIVKNYTDNIFDFKWSDDFSSARNFSFKKARMDYILWLDADDVIKEVDQDKFIELLDNLKPEVDAVSMPYHLELDSKGKPTVSLRRHRLVKRIRQFQWQGVIHEYLPVSGYIIESEVAITHQRIKHDKNRNILIYERKLEKGEELTPRDLYYYANECTDHCLYKKAIKYYRKFLECKKGWIEDEIAACGKISDCYNYLDNWELSLESALRSLYYDVPRAENCCRLGYLFLNKKKYSQAIYWYTQALEAKKPSHGLINHACYSWLPHLQLCVIYDQLYQYEKAHYHNELAALSTDHPSIQYNRDYFSRERNLPPDV
ncbi:glycosyltransferase [Marininema mesophilum]|nr:glycosyltransferase family 2 protein [Marininema mesophilum]